MASRYQMTFKICDTEEEAKQMCKDLDKSSNAYCRKRYPAKYTPWTSADRKETGFVVSWYW